MFLYCKKVRKKGWALIFSMFYGLLIMCCTLFFFKLHLNYMEISELYCKNMIGNRYEDEKIQYLRTYLSNYFSNKEFYSKEELKRYCVKNKGELNFTSENSRLYYNLSTDEFYMDIVLKNGDSKRNVYNYNIKDNNVILLFNRNESIL